MKKYQVVGIGNAIVDVISAAEDSFLAKMGIEKGIMQLVEKDRGEVLYAAMSDRIQAPGGSVANTLAGLVIHEAQTIPNEGQVFQFHGFRFEVIARQENRLTKLKLRPI